MNRLRVSDIVCVCLLAASLLFLGLSSRGGFSVNGNEDVARRVEHRVNRRMEMLDSYLEKAVAQSPDGWMHLKGLPSDMVIYRYVDDTLQSWCNRFPLMNDALRSTHSFEMIANPRTGVNSPLSSLGEEVQFCNFGTKWYLARMAVEGNVKFIAGLQLLDSNDEAPFSVRPLSSSEGAEVKVAGKPLFKVERNFEGTRIPVDSRFLLLALAMLAAAGLLFVYSKPTLKRFWIAFIPIIPLMLLFFLLRRMVGVDVPIFSPAVYADDSFFYSLAAHINYITGIGLTVSFLFMVRKEIYFRLRSKASLFGWTAFILLMIALTVFYIVSAIRSVILNSNISLELYRLENFNAASIVIYLAYIILLTCLLTLVQMLQPVFSRLWGRRIDSFLLPSRIVFAALGALFFVCYTAYLGVRKEQASLEVWAGRMAVSRDISLEMRLRSVEDRIASDPIIASLSVLDNGGASISGRLSEGYLSRIMQDYDVTVSLDPRDFEAVQKGESIAPGSRFVFDDSGSGFAVYKGAFAYSISHYGLSRVTIIIEQKSDWKYRGYASIIGPTLPGEVTVPGRYSFARYDSGRLISYRGNYAYPVRLDDDWKLGESERRIHLGGQVHFIYDVAGVETVVFSRPVVKPYNYLVSLLFLGMLCFLYFSIFTWRRPRRRAFGQSYFQTRITLVLMTSLILTLITMALVSVAFVFNRNEVNRTTLMTEKINSIQGSISARVRGTARPSDLQTGEMLRLLEDVGANTNSDITLYSPSGMVMMSTAPDIFYQLQIEPRIDADAYEAIVRNSNRYFIHKESIGRHKYYSMYAPMLGEDGALLAIISAPYTDESYDFGSYVVSHSLMIITLFIFLLLAAMFMVSRVLQSMFKPLVEMGSKMDAAGLGSLEPIRYDNKDEISGLVTAYNRMVVELDDSTRKLAQAERDKAWSGMARQVAHEIKNPLTPMKLQIQRLIRLKAKGDGSWQEKFDEISQVILDHIDILTETANEFSTFAKLYTEEHVSIDLPALLQEEISIFDNRDNIRFEYLGLPDVRVFGPKPQLTRVFVNLISNSVQALTESGAAEGVVRVSLRNSITDGCYDIVFEDSGPGVSEENVEKLFTPNFTTKNGGSGLGLAISRSVLERCGASISYSRSFSLGGACFTILYPNGQERT